MIPEVARNTFYMSVEIIDISGADATRVFCIFIIFSRFSKITHNDWLSGLKKRKNGEKRE